MTEGGVAIDLSEVGINEKQIRIALVDYQKLRDNFEEKIKKLCKRKHRWKVSSLVIQFACKTAELTREYDKVADEELNRNKQD